MITVICVVLFLALSFWQLKILFTDQVQLKYPFATDTLMKCSGLEALVILMFATAWVGLAPVLSVRLGFLELLCVVGLLKCRNKLPFSFPFIAYIVFLIWILIGLYYTTSVGFGIRMFLKYIYPLLFALLTAKVVRDGEVFLTAGHWARRVATIGIILLLIPSIRFFVYNFLWFNAAFITGIISMIIFSFALADFSDEKKKNLIWGFLLCLPCVIVVYRTDIFGTAVALSMFFFIKYKAKALPVIGMIGILGLCIMFYVPSVKNKMFIDPDKVTITDYLTGNIDENNVQTNMRKFMWEDATVRFYEGHELYGSGTGRVQAYFYTEAMDSRRGGQLHNDFLVLKCDNGMVGLVLFIAAYFLIFVHCMILYHKSESSYTRLCALVAGSSLLGVFVTMFSDNTLSYSMVTLSFPWGFYGMALGLKEKLG